MKTFKHFLESIGGFFQYDRENPTPQLQRLLKQIDAIRRDPRFAQYDDHQIELMLHHHNPDEVLHHGPEQALARYNDLSVRDGMFDGGFDF